MYKKLLHITLTSVRSVYFKRHDQKPKVGERKADTAVLIHLL